MTENCPFCQTEIPDRAIVCRGCGANKRRAVDGGIILGSFIVMAVAFQMIGTSWSILGWLIIAGCIAILVWAFRNMRKMIWVRSMR
jgi:hypothetical protein